MCVSTFFVQLQNNNLSQYNESNSNQTKQAYGTTKHSETRNSVSAVIAVA